MNTGSSGYGANAPEDERRWRTWLAGRLRDLVGRPVGEHELDRPLHEFGVSSRDATALAAEIGELLGRELPSTLVWTAPTIAELAGSLAAPPGTPDSSSEPVVPRDEPVAVVGVACRFPGASGPRTFWSMLTDGGDAIGTVPAGRWERFAPPAATTDLPRHGAFLDDVAGFDAEFFGIGPHEAEVMDPQQRLLLELTWEALADAGIPAESLRGSDCGVFAGLSATEYGQLTMSDPDRVDAWSGTGAAASIAANRVSYALGAHGPSITVDTACSSSLVAVHLAVRALADGEASAAIVGGVNVLLSPSVTANFARAGVLAGDGRCKPFDAAADGIVRGEGCGVVVMKRLADAQEAGDRILAVVLGSGVNSDGRSNGLTAPHPDAQRRLLTRAYAKAGVSVRALDYVEAHGTGTPLGDPIEAGALATVFGAGRKPERPLLVGSVKGNIGHLEGAAGMAGFIKVVLSLRNGRIPASRHHTTPSPHIDFAAGRLRVVTANTDWPRYAGVARAGVSSFGFGGTNAHVVLEEWPDLRHRGGPARTRPELVTLSARSEPRLRARARALAEGLGDGPGVGEVAAALAHGQDQAPVRAAITARDLTELRDRLSELGSGRPHPSVRTGGGDAAAPVFVFSGHGSQWQAMGERLIEEEPAFAGAVSELDPPFAAVAGVELSALLDGTADTGALATRQLALFGTQVALTELWRGYGVRPAAVIGHSMGEVAAAVAVGALAPEDGLRVMAARAALLGELDTAGAGAMAAVDLAPDELRDLGRRFPAVTVAVYASPSQCTVCGPPDQVAALVAHVAAGGGLARVLPVGGAGHSAAVEPLLDRFRESVGLLAAGTPTTAWYSTVLDDPRATPAFDTAYWAGNLRRPVRFTHAVAAALGDGHRLFVEISPHPITGVAIEQTAASLGSTGVAVVPSLRRDPDGTSDGFATALAALHVCGHPEIVRRRYPDRVVVDLPPPVWEHRTYWAPPVAAGRSGHHPFLGGRTEVPGTALWLWHGDVGLAAHPWLADHPVHGVPVLPAAGTLELLLAAATEILPHRRNPELRDVVLHEALPLAERTPVCVSADRGPGEEVRLSVLANRGGEWVPHATATAVVLRAAPSEVDAAAIVAGVVSPAGAGHPRFVLHPALGDAGLRLLTSVAGDPGDGVWLPERFGRVRVTGDPRLATRAAASATGGSGVLHLLDDTGVVLAELDGVRVASVRRADLPFTPERVAYQAEWVPREPPVTAVTAGTWVLVHDAEARAAAVAGRLAELGHEALPVPLGRRAELASLVAARDVSGVVLLAGDGPAGPRESMDLVLAAADVVRELVGLGGTPPRLWLATRDAAVITAEPGRPGGAALRGLVRVLAYEHPELRASWIDVDADEDLVRELLADAPDDECAWRAHRRHTRELTRAVLSAAEDPVPVVRDGAYLISGGLGGLGLLAARWLAERGATRIVLLGRGGPLAAAEEVIGELSDGGTEVVVVLGDVATPGVAERAVRGAVADGVPLRGVLHAAGVLADGAVLALEPGDLATVWRPKTEGALRLHEACAGQELDWWLAFSSAAALFGSPGQAAYATANAWLDAFTAWRRARGLPGTTIQWGPWGAVGGAVGRRNPILEPMPPGEGLAALSAVLASGRGETSITRMNAETVLELFPGLSARPFFTSLVGPDRTSRPAFDAAALHALTTRDPEHARAVVLDHLRSVVAEMMWRDAGLLDPHTPLTALGLDSLLAMRARAAIERDFGTSLPLPALLRGASLADLADQLVGRLLPRAVDTRGERRGPHPRDLAERWVALRWRAVLGEGADVAVDVPFSATGADDTTAGRLCAEVAAELGRDVAAGELFAEPTIAGMANVVRAELEGRGDGPVRVLAGDGSGPALFLFHAAGSPTAAYRPLVRSLRAGVTVYGMERVDELGTVEAKAAWYAEMIRLRQPEGPYRLGGWSFGGLLALETARQLTAAGGEVALLFLIDTIIPLPVADRAHDEVLHTRLRRFVDYVEETYQIGLGLTADELAGMSEAERDDVVLRRLRERVATMGDAVLEHQRTSYVDARIAESHTPTTYPGPVLLFRAKDPHPLTTTLDPRYLRTDDTLGWHEFCPDLEVVRVHGDHITVIDPPHVAVIADRVSAALFEPRS
ncbi:type I polyketide synthase [Actinophytocola oryzae]|uniref:Phthiocerol/phenolphthiocerol synthesis type-I polyketide synthase D n=1 Tax=Actinophytocola oryzae TaxID=502181 RepID=A0A4R7UWY5_9PSEU|nr:type I polyketide synthase [Actinophytocola oryzae]TDV41323.1 phthiocerol/phenolphthiocerol synthesis type-I polyketide synthase D [Actinophytocola oryzae]